MIDDDVRGAAFRHLLHTQAAAAAAQLADELDQPVDQLRAAIDTLHGQGQLRLDPAGHIVGAAGLSIRPDRHQIDLDGRRFWTWCAYDIFGIFGALRASGAARSTTPDTGRVAVIQFRDGQPESAPLVLFRPDENYAACCANTYDDWCPNSNLFHSPDAATAWATTHQVSGEVLTLDQASMRGTAAWSPLAGPVRRTGG